ncbi:MAG: hypothetical protein IRZ10_10710 [Thermoflavifilum sp.]|nr:hypothetical protein [Thermoflavifilum sp.]MCL6514879.1 hypothetical protein [Alicyclobacillus sp.]
MQHGAETKGSEVTTRFSLAELADMLGAPLPSVRRAVERLAERGELTAESFQFAGHTWRIAPSDVKRVQDELASVLADPLAGSTARQVRVKRVTRVQAQDQIVERDGESGDHRRSEGD